MAKRTRNLFLKIEDKTLSQGGKNIKDLIYGIILIRVDFNGFRRQLLCLGLYDKWLSI